MKTAIECQAASPPPAHAQKETPHRGQGDQGKTLTQKRSDSIPKTQGRMKKDLFCQQVAIVAWPGAW